MNNLIRDHTTLVVAILVAIIGSTLLRSTVSHATTSRFSILLLPGVVTLVAGLVSRLDEQSRFLAMPFALIGSGVIGLVSVVSIVETINAGEPVLAGAVIALAGAAASIWAELGPKP